MDFNSTTVAYGQTGYFSKLITDYLNDAVELQPFYQYKVSPEGIKSAIEARKNQETPRELLVQELKKQYSLVQQVAPVANTLELLLQPNTFTFVTAHQPAIFTGNLYFIYKILHVIKLAERFKKEMPGYNFVPVFWMGSEDADLDELGSVFLNGEKLTWNTNQKGAVGRMKTKGLELLIHRIEGELSVLPHGKELIDLLKECYLKSEDIQTATFRLLHKLFADYGLVVIIPDNANLKRLMQPVFEDDLFRHQPASVVNKTIQHLDEHYKVQANPRDINLFYLKDDIRELIELHSTPGKEPLYVVRNTQITFTASAIQAELENYPERFSPNVILRGLYQETVLPNIGFVGGGGETAYWLELKGLFQHYNVSYPMLILRNSFLIIEQKWQEKIDKMGWSVPEIFQSEQQLLNQLVSRQKNGELKLQQELDAAIKLYQLVKDKALAVDKSLQQHVEALQVKALKPLQELEKKLLRAEKRKYESEQRQIQAIKSALFPRNGLQERIDNFMPYYAQWGTEFIHLIFQNSLTLEQEFVVLSEKYSIGIK